MMRSILIPVFAFPPLNNGGTFRLAKFVKYLPEFGWNPVVVAPDWNEENSGIIGSYDRSMTGADTCEVARVPFRWPPQQLRALWGVRLRECLGDDRSEYGSLPADMLEICRMFMRDRGFSAVLASSLPRFLHRVADRLYREFGMPWIADHRDIVDQESLPTSASLKSRIRLKMAIYLESRLTRSAAAVTTVSVPLAQKLRARNRAPVSVIMNGFDPDDFHAVRSTGDHKTFKIVYCGGFFGKRDPSIFLDGLDLLCERSPELASRVQVWFYGTSSSKISDYSLRRRCSGLVFCGGCVTHKESMRVQSEAQVLYLISHPSAGIVTGKIFEYINMGIPILSVPGDHDATDRIIAETGTGAVCRNKEQVCSQISAWIKTWQQSGTLGIQRIQDGITKYNRRNQTRELASLLDSIAKQ